MYPNVQIKSETQKLLKATLTVRTSIKVRSIQQIINISSECEDFPTILALCMFYEPNKLFACPLLCCFTGDSSPSGNGDASGLQGDTMLPSLSLSSSVEKLEEKRALQIKQKQLKLHTQPQLDLQIFI